MVERWPIRFLDIVAADLIGKPGDVLINELLVRNKMIASGISMLVGRSYVVDVVVPRFSPRKY
jgi:hypothetical protein